MNILLTGSTGFLGSRVLSLLQKHHRIERFTGNLLNERVPDNYDCIVHLAARVPKQKKEDTKKLYEDNIRMCKNLPATRIIFASSIEAYNPHSWYGKSKLACETLLRGATILRFSVMYGAGDRIDRAIPNFIRAAITGAPITLTGPSNKRDYLHVDDAARAVACAVRRPVPGVFFIGTGKATTILEAARSIAPDAHITQKSAPKQDLLFDVTPAKKMLEFSATYTFPDRIHELIPRPIAFDLDGTILTINKRHTHKDFHSDPEAPSLLQLDTIKKGMRTLLAGLYGHYPLYIVTMRKNRALLLLQLSRLRLLHYFPPHRVVNNEDKSIVCRRLKSGVVVGDTELDITAARAAGATSIAVTWGLRTERALRAQHPDVIARNPKIVSDTIRSA